MKRRTIIPAIIGIAVISVPAAASAAMAYVSLPTGVSGNFSAMLANDNGSNPVRVAEAIAVSISPDGARLAYQNYAGTGTILTATATTVRDIASGVSASVGTSCLGGITWSPDSKWIGCNTQTATSKGLVTGNGLGLIAVPATLTEGQILPVANFIAPRGNEVWNGFAFSPNSSQIAFSLSRFSSRAFVGTLYVAPITDATARVAVLPRASGPVWGASGIAATQGTNVMVTMGGSRERMLHTQVWTVNPDGSGARRITNYKAKGLVVGPSASLWVPGGARIIGAIVGEEDVSNLAAFAVPGGAITTLLNTSSSNAVAVTPDGQRVLYATEGGRSPSIRMIGINGKGKRVLVRQAFGPSVTADWNA